jgi:hypothetical protein
MATSVLIFACVFGGAMLGLLLRGFLPEHHLSAESKEVVKLGTGLIGTMAALVLGLLVSSAKSTYDAEKNQVVEMSANIMLLDRLLAHYGPETNVARAALKRSVATAIDHLWGDGASPSTQSAPVKLEGDVLYDEIQRLSPEDNMRRSLLVESRNICIILGRSRMLLYAQMESSISMPMLVALVFWLTAIFFSFGVLSPKNATVLMTLFICAVSVSAAIFLILELNRSFDGLIQISSHPMRVALQQIGQ